MPLFRTKHILRMFGRAWNVVDWDFNGWSGSEWTLTNSTINPPWTNNITRSSDFRIHTKQFYKETCWRIGTLSFVWCSNKDDLPLNCPTTVSCEYGVCRSDLPHYNDASRALLLNISQASSRTSIQSGLVSHLRWTTHTHTLHIIAAPTERRRWKSWEAECKRGGFMLRPAVIFTRTGQHKQSSKRNCYTFVFTLSLVDKS